MVAADLDDPVLTDERVTVLKRRRFLNAIYQEWYRKIVASLPEVDGQVLEIGSGAGFLDQYVDGLVTSDIMPVRNAMLVFDACDAMPVPDESLRAIVMVNVFHHLPRVRGFLENALTALRPGGRLVLIEPWNTWWSRLVYRNLHHEPFEPDRVSWEFESSGPLSGANGALPWIVFQRDRVLLEREFPRFSIRRIQPIMPVSYLLSGGFSGPVMMPSVAYPVWRVVEKTSRFERAGMFALICVEKRRDA